MDHRRIDASLEPASLHALEWLMQHQHEPCRLESSMPFQAGLSGIWGYLLLSWTTTPAVAHTVQLTYLKEAFQVMQ